MMSHFAVVAAFPPELTALREANLKGPRCSFHEVGVGGIEAAARMAQVLSDLTQRISADSLRVLFVGSVGSIDRDIPLLSLVVPSEVWLLDYPQLLGKGYWPSLVKTQLEADPELRSNLTSSLAELDSLQLPQPIVWSAGMRADMRAELNVELSAYTPGAITAEEDVAKEYRKYACFESLELFGVAMACHTFAVRWACLSTVTNYVGKEGHQQWQTNYKRAGEITAQSLEQVFRASV